MTEVKPYVYQIEFIPTGQKYVGVRYGNKKPAEEDFWNHYFTSSKVVKSLIDEHGKDTFKIIDIKEFDTQEEAIEYEHQCLVENNVENNDDWLNQRVTSYTITQEELKKIILEKYGVENYSQTDDCKEKYKQTMIERYGVENYSHTDEYKEKYKQTSLERYGVDHYNKTDEFKERIRQTCLEKYGVEYKTQTDEFKEKSKQTMIERYGVENPMQNDEFKEKFKQTNIDRYGVESYSHTDEYKEKVKQTCLEKYGVEYYTQTDEYKEKSKQTNLEKYGVENPSKIKAKCLECNFMSNNSHVSNHQNKTGHKGRLVLLADGSWEKRT